MSYDHLCQYCLYRQYCVLLSRCPMNKCQYCPDTKCDTLQMLQVRKVLILEQEALQKTPVPAHSGVQTH